MISKIAISISLRYMHIYRIENEKKNQENQIIKSDYIIEDIQIVGLPIRFPEFIRNKFEYLIDNNSRYDACHIRSILEII